MKLPNEVILNILQFAFPLDNIKVINELCLLNKYFNDYYSNDKLWNVIFKKKFCVKLISNNYKWCYNELNYYLYHKDLKRNEYSKNINLCILGKDNSGKTNVILRFFENTFVDDFDPTLENSYKKELKINKNAVVFHVLDTATQQIVR